MFVKSLRQQWRLVWCCGISVVLFAAVIPYPIHGLIGGSDLLHRIHDTVGSIQYLPLWAVPVFAYGFVRKSEYLYIAALAALAVFVTGVWSSTLIASASWMQLATLLPLFERRALEPMKVTWHMLPAAIVAWWCTVAFSSDLIAQHINADMQNSHALRFHYSGMAAAYLAMALCALFASMWKVGRLTTALIGGSFISTGLLCLAFSNYESALSANWSQAFLASGIVALVGLRR
ncbi:MAG: hypothetical protein RLZ18_1512 [Actinomycetota bacterium]